MQNDALTDVSFHVAARPSKSPDPNAVASPERVARTRTRVSGVSQSQRESLLIPRIRHKESALINLDWTDQMISVNS